MGSLVIEQVIYNGDTYTYSSPIFKKGLQIIEAENGGGKTTFSSLICYGLGMYVKQFDFKKNEYHNEIQNELKSIIDDLADSKFNFQRNLSSIKKTIDSLKKGTLHVSEEFALFLENSDINFETGENYLRKQPIDIRAELLKNIPLLPYSFILTDEDIKTIYDTYHNWRKGENYEDVQGFCASVNRETIAENDYVLAPGRYVGIEE